MGEPISLAEAEARVFGAVIVNDWSARDHQVGQAPCNSKKSNREKAELYGWNETPHTPTTSRPSFTYPHPPLRRPAPHPTLTLPRQAWEYRPLGPFNGKNFLTTISPWVVPMAALQHARCPPPPRVDGAHPTLPYLTTPAGCNRAVDVEMEVAITRRDWPRGTEALLTKGNAKLLYWSVAQQVIERRGGGGGAGCRQIRSNGKARPNSQCFLVDSAFTSSPHPPLVSANR